MYYLYVLVLCVGSGLMYLLNAVVLVTSCTFLFYVLCTSSTYYL